MTGHLCVVTLLSETKCTQHMPWMSWVKSKPTHARNLTFYFRILWLNMGTSCHQSLPNVNKFLNSTVCGSQSQRTRFCIKSVACYFLNRVLYSNLVCKKKFWLWNTIWLLWIKVWGPGALRKPTSTLFLPVLTWEHSISDVYQVFVVLYTNLCE